jgi:UDP-N-acetylmuramate--alanine ligase
MITAQLPTIAVAGTHGKTTTSSLIAHLLKFGGKNIAAFWEGISQNYNNNLILHNEEKEMRQWWWRQMNLIGLSCTCIPMWLW